MATASAAGRNTTLPATVAIPELGLEAALEFPVGGLAKVGLRISRSKIKLWDTEAPTLYGTEIRTADETMVDEINYREIRIEGQDWYPAHPDAFYDLLDVIGANLYVASSGDNPTAADKFMEMLRRFNKQLMITEFGSISAAPDGLEGREKTDPGHPARHHSARRIRGHWQASRDCRQRPVGLDGCASPIDWRWYNRGNGTFTYALLDHQYDYEDASDVGKQEIAQLREARQRT